MREFVGRVALITGTTGIGRAIAKRFAAGGAQVVACGIDAAGNQELTREAEELSLTLLVEHCDVTNVDRMRAVSHGDRQPVWRLWTSSSMLPRFILLVQS